MTEPTVPLILPGGVAMPFQRLEPRVFRMGERGLGDSTWGFTDPVVSVAITRPFFMARFPVTQAQFAVWTAAEKIEHANHFKDRPDHPAENMDWFQATAFCRWLTHAAKLPAGWMACLPTEAEWEYACRAGTETEYHSGDGEAALTEAGWFGEEWGSGSTHPVGKKMPNAFGLHDMHGNVWEWCHDPHDPHRYAKLADGASDPGYAQREADYRAERGIERSENAPRRVLRGGSWYNSPGYCRSAIRIRGEPGYRCRNVGFRPVLVPGPVAQPLAERAPAKQGDRRRSEGRAQPQGAIDLSREKTPRSGQKIFRQKAHPPIP